VNKLASKMGKVSQAWNWAKNKQYGHLRLDYCKWNVSWLVFHICDASWKKWISLGIFWV